MFITTITVDGITQTIDGPHARLIGETMVNGHDSYGDKVTYCAESDTWNISTISGRRITVRLESRR